MTTVPAIRCPECGAETRRAWQDDGTQVLVCTDYNCPRVIAYVVSVPEPLATIKPNADLGSLIRGVEALTERIEALESWASDAPHSVKVPEWQRHFAPSTRETERA